MNDISSIMPAVKIFENHKIPYALLHCTSEYPASITESNLKAILTLIEQFDCPIGFSDHTPETIASQLAVALGACIIEKHFTNDKTLKGTDHQFSLTPNEMASLIKELHEVKLSLGDGEKITYPEEQLSKFKMGQRVQRRSISVEMETKTSIDIPDGN